MVDAEDGLSILDVELVVWLSTNPPKELTPTALPVFSPLNNLRAAQFKWPLLIVDILVEVRTAE